MSSTLRSLLALLTLALASCATTYLDYEGPEGGWLVVSMLLPNDARGFNSTCLSYRGKGGGDRGTVCASMNPSVLRTDMQREHEITKVEESSHRGGVRARKLRPGDYEIYSYSISDGNNGISPTKPLAIPFSIKPGVTTYLGTYQWNWVMGKNIWGQDVVKGANLAFGNRQARDVEKAVKLRNVPTKVESAVPAAVR